MNVEEQQKPTGKHPKDGTPGYTVEDMQNDARLPILKVSGTLNTSDDEPLDAHITDDEVLANGGVGNAS
ncbi:MAG: hypothetical protein AAB557_05720 [Patescibacteria group bacterium]